MNKRLSLLKMAVFLFGISSVILASIMPKVVPAGHWVYESMDHFLAKRLITEDKELFRRGEIVERNQMSLVVMRLINNCLQPANEGKTTSYDLRKLSALIDEFTPELKGLFDMDMEDIKWRIAKLARTAPPETNTTLQTGVLYNELPIEGFQDKPEERFVVDFVPESKKDSKTSQIGGLDLSDKALDMPITVNAHNAPVKDIIFLMFKDSPYSLDISEKLSDNLTIQLKDTPLREGIEILSKRGIFVTRNRDMFLFTPPGDEITEIIPLAHIKAQDILETLKRFRGPRGNVEADSRTNSLVIKDTRESIARMIEVIQQIDVQNEETYMITKVFSFRYTNANDMRNMVSDIRSKEGKIEVDRRLNALVVQDSVSRVKRMADLFNALDVPVSNTGIKTRVYRLSYADINDVKRILESEIITRGASSGEFKPVIQADSRTNSLIISDFEEKQEMIEEYISLLDTPTKQVHIEAKIMQINMADKDLFGIKWNALLAEQNSTRPLSEETIYSMDFSEADAALSQLKFGTLAREQFTVLLQFLMNRSETKILATPSITVINKEDAEINVGATVPIPKYERNQTTGNMEITGYNEKKTGITLNVKPMIAHSQDIMLDVKPKIDEITEYRGQFNEIPVTANREARTKILVRDGRTLVIAGLIQEKKSEGQIKVPVLHRLPLLGHAFKRSSKNVERTETVIFITPNIINSGGV